MTIPRRSYVDRRTPEETKISEVIEAIERMAADVRLTDAQCLLMAARDSLGDFVDGIHEVRRFVRTEPEFAPVATK